jgi:hypothetical protein
MHVRCDDPKIYAVAAVDGADPLNPRPADMPQRPELVVAVMNDHPTARRVSLRLAPPVNHEFRGALVKRSDTAAKITEERLPGSRQALNYSVELAPRGMAVVTMRLLALPAAVRPVKPVRRTQHFSGAILQTVTVAKPVETPIKIPERDRKRGKRAWLRIVVERLAAGEGTVKVNGKSYALPPAPTAENTPAIVQFAIDPAVLKEDNAVSFHAADGHAGYLLGMASVIVEGK